MVTTDILVAQGWNTLSFEANLRIGLCSRFYRIDDIAIHCINLDIAAQGRLCIGHRYRRIDIHILPLEDRMSAHNHLDEQIASRTAICTWLTLFTDADTLSIVDTSRNRHFEFLPAGCITGAAARRTFFFDNLSASAAVRTRLHVLNRAKQRLLGKYYLTFAAALRARFRICSRLCACTVTRLTLILLVELDLLLTSGNRLLKSDADAGAQICSLHRTSGCSASSSAPKEIAEDVTEDITHIAAVKIEAVESTKSACSAALLKCRMAKLVVLSAFLRITQDCIRL